MNIITITKDNFEAEVLESGKPVLIDFWAIKIGKVNVDEEQMLALKFGITSIPTLMLFKDGKEADKLVGLRSKEELKQLLGL